MADLQRYADDFLAEMVDEAILGTCFEIHRSSRLGTLFLDDVDPSEEEKYKIVDEVGLDVFGQPKSGSKKTLECECPNCKRTLAAIRFAPHLEKCMGMGRNSSRIASQRIANSGKIAAGLGESLCNDDDPEFGSDADWFSVYEGGSSSSRKGPKKRRVEKIAPSPRSRGPISKTRGPSNSPRNNNGMGGTSRPHPSDLNDNIHVDVVGASGVNILNPQIAHVSESSAPMGSQRTKSPFELGDAWESQSHGSDKSNDSMSITPPSGLVKKKAKSAKTTNTKKSKKRHAVSQNYSFS